MANLQTLYIIKAEDGSIINADTSYDLATIVGGKEVPKEVTGVYVVQNGTTFTEYKYPAKGSKYVTKVTNQATGDVAYLGEPTGEVADLLVNTCDACVDNRSSAVTIDSSCTDPVYVQICNNTEPDVELEFTDAIPICVDNGDGTFSTWYSREMITWNEVTSSIVTRITEYSSNGVTWSTTAPTGTFTLGSCIPESVECELIVTEVQPICAEGCQQWYMRSKIVWDEANCLQVSETIEYSQDLIVWTTTAPLNYSVGICTIAWDVVEQYIVTDTPLVIPADTVHSISYKVISGKVDITIGSTTLTYQAGEYDSEEATTTIQPQYTFTPIGKACVKIKVIKQRLC